ncbi:nucleotidyltransferase domain-containing protein [Brevibacillus laterosporus]|uniref:nucleotidyltransferase domain-containing protein n=1 Tax=Brevibacillus laterosporus TaxID=1465 RepID=UPI00215C9D9D|nr:nucleotidyltransferase domain-containing protein [Brevibacillus laterosporus]MCR8994736.1 nucleotidyltransferase domain-containing protein [Brevibacillus laterosporus]
MNERKTVLKALVGSHNYGLATPESDKDYKVFVLPTFDDLYHGKMYAKGIVGAEDHDVHDIRKAVNLWWKSNLNFLEVLYSKQLNSYSQEIRTILEMKKEIVRMNLPYLYNACKGMHFEKMKRLDKATEGTEHLVEKYGYNTKEALHAYRILDFPTRFAFTDFEDFEWAMTYKGITAQRMLDIKHGEYTREQYEELVARKYAHFEKFAEVYRSMVPNEEIKQEMESLIYKMILKNITKAK